MFGGSNSTGPGVGGRDNKNHETLGGRLSHHLLTIPPPPLPFIQLDHPAAMGGSSGGGGGGDDDDEFPRRDERVPQWSYQETKDFIGIRAELEREFSSARRNKYKTLWEVVASKMKERGHRRTPDQCKSKWKNLVNRYKGKETSDLDNGRQCPFFEELHAVFTERASNMQRLLLESEAGPMQAKKKGKRISGQSSEEYSEDEDDDEYESDEEKSIRSNNPPKRKAEKGKRARKGTLEKPKQPSTGNFNDGDNSLGGILGMLRNFFQQQQEIEMQWRESMERHAQERQLVEQEWRHTMEKLERERMMIEQAWRERDEQRRTREESRAEKRDALLTALLNKLIRENHL